MTPSPVLGTHVRPRPRLCFAVPGLRFPGPAAEAWAVSR